MAQAATLFWPHSRLEKYIFIHTSDYFLLVSHQLKFHFPMESSDRTKCQIIYDHFPNFFQFHIVHVHYLLDVKYNNYLDSPLSFFYEINVIIFLFRFFWLVLILLNSYECAKSQYNGSTSNYIILCQEIVVFMLRTVPTIVSAHAFCASRKTWFKDFF